MIADVRSHLLEEPEHLREAMVADRWASHPGPAAQLWRACWRAAADSNVSCPVAVEVEGRGRCLDMVDAEDEEEKEETKKKKKKSTKTKTKTKFTKRSTSVEVPDVSRYTRL